MISTDERTECEALASLAGWDVAARLNCGFTGDCNPIDHGGIFYDVRDWERFGYAACVEFWRDPEDDGVLHVQRGTINRPDDETMGRAWGCIGIPADDELRANMHAQIEAARAYCGIESDSTSYPDVMTYRTEDWAEWRIWRSVRGWLASLGD